MRDPATKRWKRLRRLEDGWKFRQQDQRLVRYEQMRALTLEELVAADKEILERYENQVRHDERNKLLNDWKSQGFVS